MTIFAVTKTIKIMRKAILVISTLAALLSISAEAYAQKQTGIVAHRGFWNCDEAGYAKNSVAALRCAQEAGFWGSEFDVNMTSDGELIVYHDSDVEGKKIEEHPYSEFKDFKIANGETIPTIDQYLEQGKKYPETMLVYELKPHSCSEVEDRFVEITYRKLEEHGLMNPERVMFISFSLHMCEKIAKEHLMQVLLEHDALVEFKRLLTECVEEIFNPDVPFFANPQEKHCSYCSLAAICGK